MEINIEENKALKFQISTVFRVNYEQRSGNISCHSHGISSGVVIFLTLKARHVIRGVKEGLKAAGFETGLIAATGLQQLLVFLQVEGLGRGEQQGGVGLLHGIHTGLNIIARTNSHSGYELIINASVSKVPHEKAAAHRETNIEEQGIRSKASNRGNGSLDVFRCAEEVKVGSCEATSVSAAVEYTDEPASIQSRGNVPLSGHIPRAAHRSVMNHQNGRTFE